MHSRGGLFFGSLFLTLLLLLPMVGALLFFVAQRQQQDEIKQAAAAGGAVIEPGAQNTHRLLLAVQQETPAFLLLRVDAPAQCITFAALPSDLQVQAPSGYTTLAECYLAAGPARAAQLLQKTVGLGVDAYLAATPDCYAAILTAAAQNETEAGNETDGPPAVRLDTAGILDKPAREALDYRLDGGSVAALDSTVAAAFLQAADAEAHPALRAALWAAFWRQNRALLQNLAQSAKQSSNRTLTDLSAQDYAEITQTLRWLSGRSEVKIDYTLPQTQPTAHGCKLTEDGTAEVRALLG